MNGAWWIEAMHPEGFEVSIAEVRQGCDEADDISTVEGNAALIAAAPALYEALKACFPVMQDLCLNYGLREPEKRALNQARAALALAEGET